MIALFSNGCPKCKVLKAKLDQSHIMYKLEEDICEMQSLGITSVPCLGVDGQLLQFSDAVKWVNERI